MGEYGVEVSSRICIETCNCVMYPHAMPLHSLGSNPCFTYSDDGDEPIHAWADNMVVGKATLYIRLNSACILMTLKKNYVNKVASMNQCTCDAEPSKSSITLDSNTATKRAQAPQVVYILQYLLAVLLTTSQTPRDTHGILRDLTKNLRIIEEYYPLWDWIRFRLLPYYISTLYLQVTMLPSPLKDTTLIRNWLLHFKTVIPYAAYLSPPLSHPTTPIPQSIAAKLTSHHSRTNKSGKTCALYVRKQKHSHLQCSCVPTPASITYYTQPCP